MHDNLENIMKVLYKFLNFEENDVLEYGIIYL